MTRRNIETGRTAKAYGAARGPGTITGRGVEPLRLGSADPGIEPIRLRTTDPGRLDGRRN
jgi:hypothetical protein